MAQTVSKQDWVHLFALLGALSASNKQLRRDECGDWRIKGTAGHIYADGAGFLLVAHPQSARAWGFAKKRLAFCRLTQDGDDEGCLHLARLPTPDEAIEIRDILGIHKRKEFSEETLAAMRARLPQSGGTTAAPIDLNAEEVLRD